MRFIRRSALLLVASLGLAAMGLAHAEVETRVGWIPECPQTDDGAAKLRSKSASLGGALVAAIAPKLIEGAVDSAALALKAAGEDRKTAFPARSGEYFYFVTESADIAVVRPCLVVLRGEFKTGADVPPDLGWAAKDSAFDGLQRTRFLLMAEVKALRGGKFFQLVPAYLKVDEFEERSFFHPNDRDYLVALTLTLPGIAQPIGSAELEFKDVRLEELKPGDPRLKAAASRPLAFPAESADVANAKAKLDAALAPFLLAQDILTPAEKSVLSPPSPLWLGCTLAKNDPGCVAFDPSDPTKGRRKSQLQAESEAFCAELAKFNAGKPEKLALGDDRCLFRLDEPRARVDSMAAEGHRSADRIAWATGICGAIVKDAGKDNPHCKNLDPGEITTKAPGVLRARQSLRTNPDPTKMAPPKTYTYVTTDAVLTETREGSKFALYLGNALTAAKPEVSAALKDKLLAKSSTEQAAADAAARDTANAVLLTDLDVSKAEDLLGEALREDTPVPSEVTAARITLLKAKIASNAARRKAGFPVLYAEVQ